MIDFNRPIPTKDGGYIFIDIHGVITYRNRLNTLLPSLTRQGLNNPLRMYKLVTRLAKRRGGLKYD